MLLPNANEVIENQIKELRSNGVTVYSFSRLGAFNTCEYSYFNTYIERKKQIPNVYSEIGTVMHDSIENLYKRKMNRKEVISAYENKLIENDIKGIKFPNDKIKNSYIADMSHYLSNFKVLNGKFTLEKQVLFEIEGSNFTGFIDAIRPSKKGKPYVDIIDWKTSSKFSGDKLQDAGRQLLMYKYAIETTTPFKVDKLMWCMLKYVNVCYKQKNGKLKERMLNRGKWLSEMRKTFTGDLKKLDYDELEIEILLDQAGENNNMDNLPAELREKYWLEDCYVEYEATEERMLELNTYVKETVRTIETKSKNAEEWKPVEINKYNSFYCSNLCGHRKSCSFYQDFINENKESFDKKETKPSIDSELFELFT
ncbi:PD-(D/E)XK nuclease family protein [Streptomyces sp. NPDC057927]